MRASPRVRYSTERRGSSSTKVVQSNTRDEDARWLVIANCEDEFAIWPASTAVPTASRINDLNGWRAECEAYIRRIDRKRRASVVCACLESAKIRL
jgi:uncharacterized protein YbdZ (MbtH family)